MTRAVFITRPAHQAALLAAALQARGFAPILAPALERTLISGPPLDPQGLAAIAVTSANGVAGLAPRFAPRDLPLYAVGAATAEAARRAGFTRVETASGDGAALAALIAARLSPGDGAILYPRAAEPAFDLAAGLAALGFAVREAAVYEMTPAPSLPPAALAALDAGAPSAALLLSARSAASFGNLVVAAGRGAALAHVAAFCLSPAVAAAASAYPFAALHAATEPSQAALIDLLEAATPSK